MPFTLSHAAAALPFRRVGLVMSAVVAGTFAPDFEYFLRLGPRGGFGHTFAGAFLFSLPLALLALWIFHGLVRAPLVQLFPEPIRLRIDQKRFQWGGAPRFLLIALSVLVGIATHIVWDSFTHWNRWATRRWSLLGQTVDVPVVGPWPVFNILQHASTLAGLLILCVWGMNWYRRTRPRGDRALPAMPVRRKRLILGGIAAAALAGGVVRVAIAISIWGITHHREQTVGDGVVTVMALTWWMLVLYGAVVSRWRTSGVPV